jgi:hypothetical protein
MEIVNNDDRVSLEMKRDDSTTWYDNDVLRVVRVCFLGTIHVLNVVYKLRFGDLLSLSSGRKLKGEEKLPNVQGQFDKDILNH